jgi:hypothetical protein
MSAFYGALLLIVAIAAAAAAIWLLYRVDQAAAIEHLSSSIVRRLLLVMCGFTSAVPSESIWIGLGDGFLLNFFIVIAVSIAFSVLHYRLRTRLLFYQLELGLLWWSWFVGLVLFGATQQVTGLAVFWLMFSFIGGMALYPANRRELRRRDSEID